ncbi:hypothetical protein QTP86_001369, partial [Hemibagrus guttatus]
MWEIIGEVIACRCAWLEFRRVSALGLVHVGAWRVCDNNHHLTECDAVIIGDSIVRHVRATVAKCKVRTRCHPDARLFDVSAQVPMILKKNIGAVVLHAGTNDIGLRQTEILKKAWWRRYTPHRPRQGSSCQDHFPRSSEESRGSVDYLLLMNGYSHGVNIRNYLLLITGIFSGSILGSTVLMACTQAEQQSSQTTSPGHYAPSD